ncbi:hypothetical protein GCM10018952_59940 [Streptosporangium vulgare]
MGVQGEQGLEQGRAAQVPFHVELHHEALEGDVLPREPVQHDPAGALEQFLEGGLAGQVAAQGQRGREEADHGLQLGAAATRRGDAHAEVGLAGVPVQQDLVGGEQHHERRAAGAAGEGADRGDHVGVDPELDLVARAGPTGGTRPVRREVQGRDPGQLLGPPAQLGVRGAQVARVLAVLQGQLGQRGGAPAPVVGGHLGTEHVQRPAVAVDVVQDDAEHVLVGAELDQRDAERRRGGEVEGRVGELRDQGRDLPLAPAGLALDGEAVDRHRRRRLDDRHGLPGHLAEPGPQALVPCRHRAESGLQGDLVKATFQPVNIGCVVGRVARIEPVEEPKPLLAIGQGVFRP